MNWSLWGIVFLCAFLIIYAAIGLLSLSFKEIATVTYFLAGLAGVFLFVGVIVKRQNALP